MKKKFITVKFKEKSSNGAYSKARKDIDQIVMGMGFEPLEVEFTFITNRLLRKTKIAYLYESIASAIEWIGLSKKVEKGDILLYQHPMVSSPIVYFFLSRLKKKKDIKLMVIIHDLYSLRTNEKNMRGTMKDEKILNLADVITCHNSSMKKAMILMGEPKEKLVCLEIFDYLIAEEPKTVPQKSEGVIVAGLLDRHKSEYLYHLDELKGICRFNLFGLYFTGQYSENQVVYYGSFPADKLYGHMKGSFGLVWDGTSTTTCAGPVGEYLKYNNPHKASSYLAAGFPIIVWSQSALADFVKENGIGFCVDSLQEMEKRISSITDQQYEIMVRKARELGSKIRNGYFTRKAINTMLENIGER